MLKKLDRSILEGETIALFRAAIRSEYTRDPYERRLVNFLNNTGFTCDEFVKFAKEKAGETEKIIIKFIGNDKTRLENNEISPSTIFNNLKAIRLLLDMNDVVLNWKKIRRVLPRARRYALDRIPTIEEIRKILDACDLRGKALFLAMLSCGIREGAVQWLRVGDLKPIRENDKLLATRLLVYAGDPEQYITFITPEAYRALEEYLDYRKKNGETIKPESPLFRDRFDVHSRIYHDYNGASAEHAIAMTPAAVRHYFNRLFYTIGLRNTPKKRHEFSIHSYRKWFKTRCENSGMKSINIEIMMGHSIGISDSYYRPQERELLEDYLKAINMLSVTQAEELQHKLVVQEANFEKKIQEIDAKLNSLVSSILESPRATRQRVSDGLNRISDT